MLLDKHCTEVGVVWVVGSIVSGYCSRVSSASLNH